MRVVLGVRKSVYEINNLKLNQMKKISLLFSVVLFIMLGSCAKNDKVEIIESQDNLQMAEFRNMDEFNNTVED